jgi:hypothetical protein
MAFLEIGTDDVVQWVFTCFPGASVDREYGCCMCMMTGRRLFVDTHINLQTKAQLLKGRGPVTSSGASQPCCWAKTLKRLRAMMPCVMR